MRLKAHGIISHHLQVTYPLQHYAFNWRDVVKDLMGKKYINQC